MARIALTADSECKRCQGRGREHTAFGLGLCPCTRAEPVRPPAQPPSESACVHGYIGACCICSSEAWFAATSPSTGIGGSCEDPIEWWATMPETSDIDRYKRNHADECARKEIVAVVRAAAYFAREEASGYIEVTLYKEENPMGGLASALDALRAKLLKARGE